MVKKFNREQSARRMHGMLWTLLVLMVIIVIVSAAVYNLLYLRSSPIPAEKADIRFVSGADSSTAGASIGTNSTFVSFNSMAGWPNATRIYEDAVGIKNFDTSSRTIELKFYSWSGSTSNMEHIYVKIFDGTGTQQGSTVVAGTTDSSSGQLTIPANATWWVQWEIKWAAGAKSTDSVSVTLQLIVNGE